MKMYKVTLSRNYIVEVFAENEVDAKQNSEYFISHGKDISSNLDNLIYKFRIQNIEPVVNDAFEVEEIS